MPSSLRSNAKDAILATDYFAVAHPSLTNYLEVVGGSNFGVHSDNVAGLAQHKLCYQPCNRNTEYRQSGGVPAICPIWGTGTDAATPALDCTNEVTGPPCEINLDGKASYPAVSTTLGITIAEQLVMRARRGRRTRKTCRRRAPISLITATAISRTLRISRK